MSFMICEFGTVAAYANAFNDDFKKRKPEAPSPRASGTGFMERVKDFFSWSVEALASVPGRVVSCFWSRDNVSAMMPKIPDAKKIADIPETDFVYKPYNQNPGLDTALPSHQTDEQIKNADFPERKVSWSEVFRKVCGADEGSRELD